MVKPLYQKGWRVFNFHFSLQYDKFRLEETKVFDNTNPYTIRFEETDGRKRYFVAFTDGQGNFRETEVTKAVYMEFCHFIKCERNLRRSDERHLEQSELTEETLCRRAVHKPNPCRANPHHRQAAVGKLYRQASRKHNAEAQSLPCYQHRFDGDGVTTKQ